MFLFRQFTNTWQANRKCLFCVCIYYIGLNDFKYRQFTRYKIFYVDIFGYNVTTLKVVGKSFCFCSTCFSVLLSKEISWGILRPNSSYLSFSVSYTIISLSFSILFSHLISDQMLIRTICLNAYYSYVWNWKFLWLLIKENNNQSNNQNSQLTRAHRALNSATKLKPNSGWKLVPL